MLTEALYFIVCLTVFNNISDMYVWSLPCRAENSKTDFLVAEPSNFTVGLTSELKIACRFKNEDFPKMSAVLSLILYYSIPIDQPEYNYVTSVSVFDGLTYDKKVNANVVGAINSKNESFLELNFTFPQKNVAGIYQCEVNGLERMGKPLTIYNSITITELMPDFKEIVDKIQALTISNDNLKKALNEVKRNNP